MLQWRRGMTAALRDMDEIYGADTEDLTGDQAGPSEIEEKETELSYHTD